MQILIKTHEQLTRKERTREKREKNDSIGMHRYAILHAFAFFPLVYL